MGIARFTSLYDTEEKCISLIKEWRLKEGITCRRCGSTSHYWISTRLRFRCTNCRRETTLRSGTAMEYSKLSFRDWVHTILVFTDNKKPISAAHLQRILRLKYYTPAWSMLHKIRYAMGQSVNSQANVKWQVVESAALPVLARITADSGDTFHTMVQSWKVFIEADDNKVKQPVKGEIFSESGPYTRIRLRAHLRSLMPPVFRAGMVSAWEPGRSKGSGSSGNAGELNYSGIDSLMKRDQDGSLNWLGIIWVNARRNFHGVYHNISEKYIQNYLGEYAYLTNHRHLGTRKFDAMISLVLCRTWFLPLVQASVSSGIRGPEPGP